MAESHIRIKNKLINIHPFHIYSLQKLCQNRNFNYHNWLGTIINESRACVGLVEWQLTFWDAIFVIFSLLSFDVEIFHIKKDSMQHGEYWIID